MGLMKLRELRGRLIKIVDFGPKQSFASVEKLEDADGVFFVCRVCENGHGVICYFKGHVPDDWRPGPGRWNAHGTTIDDLTLDPSVDLTPVCSWHGWIQNGEVT